MKPKPVPSGAGSAHADQTLMWGWRPRRGRCPDRCRTWQASTRRGASPGWCRTGTCPCSRGCSCTNTASVSCQSAGTGRTGSGSCRGRSSSSPPPLSWRRFIEINLVFFKDYFCHKQSKISSLLLLIKNVNVAFRSILTIFESRWPIYSNAEWLLKTYVMLKHWYYHKKYKILNTGSKLRWSRRQIWSIWLHIHGTRDFVLVS